MSFTSEVSQNQTIQKKCGNDQDGINNTFYAEEDSKLSLMTDNESLFE